MGYPNKFWDGVGKVGSGLGGLGGACYLAASWGTTSSVAGVFSGVAGVLVGGLLGAIAGGFVLSVAVFLAALVVETLLDLTCNVISGVGMMLGLTN